MPDSRSHRGPHPEDRRLFAPENIPVLRKAMSDYCWLLTRGYALKSSLKLVGDRFSLTQRQRLALMRAACSEQQAADRERRRIATAELPHQSLVVDGYNLLITIEAALSGGAIFRGTDGCYRDLAGMHGSYRRVSETTPAIAMIGRFLSDWQVGDVQWLLDKPVSNSGRLKTHICSAAEQNEWNWRVDMVLSPDHILAESDDIVVSTDSAILDRDIRWTNLAADVIDSNIPDAWMVDLSMGR